MGAGSLARSRQHPSPTRHGAFRTFGLNVGRTTFAPPQPEGYAMLVMLRAGTAMLRTDDALAFLSTPVSAWVPADTRFALDVRAACALRIAYASDANAPARAFGPVVASPLLHEIVERSIAVGYLDPDRPRDARLLAVALDELHALSGPPRGPFALPTPRETRLARAVATALESSDGTPTVSSLAADAAMSVRSFERAFRRETGLTPRLWLRFARLGLAAAALATDGSVTDAGFVAGYASTSAFIAAYRSVFGETPGAATRRNSRESERIAPT